MLAGAHRDFPAAQRAMTRVQPKSYRPIAANQKVYHQLYALYRELHDAFGRREAKADLGRIMKDLLRIKAAVSR